MSRIGNGFIGTDNVKTTTIGMEEIIPQNPVNWTYGYKFYKFSFVNKDTACHVIINGGNPIYLDADMGFETNEIDVPIFSFKIVESGINYIYIGAY